MQPNAELEVQTIKAMQDNQTQLPRVTHINFSAGQISEDNVSEFAALLNGCLNLLCLCLNRFGEKRYTITPYSISMFVFNIPPSLQELNLNNIKLNDTSKLAIVLLDLPNLRTLNLSYNNLRSVVKDNHNATLLACALQHLQHLEVLNLNYTNLGPKGMQEIARALYKLPKLNKLYLNNNNIGYGIKYLIHILLVCINLRTILVCSNNLTMDYLNKIYAILPFTNIVSIDAIHTDVYSYDRMITIVDTNDSNNKKALELQKKLVYLMSGNKRNRGTTQYPSTEVFKYMANNFLNLKFREDIPEPAPFPDEDEEVAANTM